MAESQLIVLEREQNREREREEMGEYRKIKTQRERREGDRKRVIKVQRQQRFHLANNKTRVFATNSFLPLMYTAFR